MILNIWHKNANGAIYLEATREVTVAMRRGERASKKNGDRLIRLPSRLCFSSPLLSSTPSTPSEAARERAAIRCCRSTLLSDFPRSGKLLSLTVLGVMAAITVAKFYVGVRSDCDWCACEGRRGLESLIHGSHYAPSAPL